MRDVWKRIPGADLLTTTVAIAGLSAGVAILLAPPVESTDAGITYDTSCPYHNPNKEPYIEGSHPDVTIHTPPGAIDTTNGVTKVYTDRTTGQRIIGFTVIQPGEPFPSLEIHHNIIIGAPPPSNPDFEHIELDGQVIQLDIVSGVVPLADAAKAPKQATVLFQAPRCRANY